MSEVSCTSYAGVSEWQTRQTQNLLWATTYGFKSHCRQFFMNEGSKKEAENPLKSRVSAFFICFGTERFCPLLSPFCPLTLHDFDSFYLLVICGDKLFRNVQIYFFCNFTVFMSQPSGYCICIHPIRQKQRSMGVP